MLRIKSFSIMRVSPMGVALLLLCALAMNSNAGEPKPDRDYLLIPFEQLFAMADLIVIGRVHSIETHTFSFHVDRFLKGSHASETLSIKPFNPAETIASRAQPYAKQQAFSLFLLKPEKITGNSVWRIIGAAGEGELPIEGEWIYTPAYNLKGLTYEKRQVHGVMRNLQGFSLTDFIHAVQHYTDCFSWQLVEHRRNNKSRSWWIASKICDDESLKHYQDKSGLHHYLVEQTLRRIPATSHSQ